MLTRFADIETELRSTKTPLLLLALGTLRFPGLCVIIPNPDPTSETFDLFSKPQNLFYICPFSLKLSKSFPISLTRESLTGAAPAIRVSLSVLMLMMTSLGRKLLAQDLDDKLRHLTKTCNAINDLIVDDDAMASIHEITRSIESIDGRQDLSVISNILLERMKQLQVSPALFSGLSNLLPESEQSVASIEASSGFKMTSSNRDGSVAWVHSTAIDQFNRDGLTCIQVLPSPSDAPAVHTDDSVVLMTVVCDEKQSSSTGPFLSLKQLFHKDDDDDCAVDESWRNRPCKDEIDCRLVVIDIVKHLMGDELNWNTGHNWSDNLPLGQWDGEDSRRKRKIGLNWRGLLIQLNLEQTQGTGCLSPTIGCLVSLTSLNLSGCSLSSLPESIALLSLLSHLNLSFNELSCLPDTFIRLTSLSELDVGYNKIVRLPSWICRLTSVTKLNVQLNGIASLPDEIGEMASLSELIVSSNRLKSLPNSIGNIMTLTSLNFTSNQISSMPNSIGNLRLLKDIYGGSNCLTTLPASIGNLSSLIRLSLQSNQINRLPDSMNQLRSMIKMNLRDNPISMTEAQQEELRSKFGRRNLELEL